MLLKFKTFEKKHYATNKIYLYRCWHLIILRIPSLHHVHQDIKMLWSSPRTNIYNMSG